MESLPGKAETNGTVFMNFQSMISELHNFFLPMLESNLSVDVFKGNRKKGRN